MKSLLYHGFGIKGYQYRRTRYEKGEIIFELEPEGRPEVPQGQKLMRRGFRWRDVHTAAIGLKAVVLRVKVPRSAEHDDGRRFIGDFHVDRRSRFKVPITSVMSPNPNAELAAGIVLEI